MSGGGEPVEAWALRYPETKEDPNWREVRSAELVHASPSLKLDSQLLPLPPHP